jgi:hypothetical protein
LAPLENWPASQSVHALSAVVFPAAVTVWPAEQR